MLISLNIPSHTLLIDLIVNIGNIVRCRQSNNSIKLSLMTISPASGCFAYQGDVENGSQDPVSYQRSWRNQPRIQSGRRHDHERPSQSTWVLWSQPPDGDQ